VEEHVGAETGGLQIEPGGLRLELPAGAVALHPDTSDVPLPGDRPEREAAIGEDRARPVCGWSGGDGGRADAPRRHGSDERRRQPRNPHPAHPSRSEYVSPIRRFGASARLAPVRHATLSTYRSTCRSAPSTY